VATVSRSTLAKQKCPLTRESQRISYIKNFHRNKSALAKHALELGQRMNWPQTQIVAFEKDFRKQRFTESLFINSTTRAVPTKASF